MSMLAEATIELDDVQMTYGAGPQQVHALSAVDLSVASNDYLAVMGPSGSGKSTLLNVMGLLVRPSNGVVRVGGRMTRDLSDSELSELRGVVLGFVFQSFHLLASRTALENIELPLIYGRVAQARRNALVREAVDRVGLSARAHAYPSELSGGERQRVAIARAVVRRPRVLLCDEPTGNLDTHASTRVLSLLEELNADGVALVVVTHDHDVARRARRLLTLRDGVATEHLASGIDG